MRLAEHWDQAAMPQECGVLDDETRIYGCRLLFGALPETDEVGSIGLFEVPEIGVDAFPVELIYQNNQERNIRLLTDREFSLPKNGQRWVFDVEGVLRFAWTQGAPRIDYVRLELATEALFRFWLYHVVLPIYLSLHRIYKFLHAGAVEIDGGAVLFMAPSHGGKSTLTDYFLQRGHPLITDDKMATFEREGGYFAVPSHPFHRPFRTVEVLGHHCERCAEGALPVRAVYVLEKEEPEAACTIRPLKGVEKFSRLHEGGEMNFSFFTPEYVAYLAALANRVEVFAVRVPQDIERLGEVHDTIVAHLNSKGTA